MTDIAACMQRWLISGRVQGVGYRAWLAHEARALGLSGWVRNLEDGRVEALLHGPAAGLARLQGTSRRGPPAARVEKLDAEAWNDEKTGVAAGAFAQAATASAPLPRRSGTGDLSIPEKQ